MLQKVRVGRIRAPKTHAANRANGLEEHVPIKEISIGTAT
jgi:hypothetical protein